MKRTTVVTFTDAGQKEWWIDTDRPIRILVTREGDVMWSTTDTSVTMYEPAVETRLILHEDWTCERVPRAGSRSSS